MRFRRTTLGFVGVIALVATMVLPATSTGAQTIYDVSVGQFLEGAPAESMRFLPYDIDVHQGDTLHFASLGFHTATLLPVGQGPVEWYDANSGAGTTNPYALLRPDPDDGPTSFKAGNVAAFPTDPTCGGAGQPACSFNGSAVANSGAPFAAPMDFSVTVNASAGSTFYVLCIVHGPNMRMKVDVVAASVPATTFAEADAQSAAALEQDTDSAVALHERFGARQTFHTKPDGTRVWDAWAGVDNRHVSLLAMYPSRLVVSRGDTVQWHFDTLEYEVHTVTMPLDIGRDIARNSFLPVCDPDGDAGPGPDNPPNLMEPPFCSVATQLEIDLDDRFLPPSGNGVFRGSDLESSGVLGLDTHLGDPNYEVTFARRSTDGPFKYLCMIHPFMRGKVVVG